MSATPASSALYPADEALSRGERVVLNLYVVSALLVFVLMMLLGLDDAPGPEHLARRPARRFYQVMTAHGAAMVGTIGLASSAVMWFFLRKYVRLSLSIFAANYVLFMLGALAILAAVFIGGYAGAWTFLYPLPVHSMNVWSVNAAGAVHARLSADRRRLPVVLSGCDAGHHPCLRQPRACAGVAVAVRRRYRQVAPADRGGEHHGGHHQLSRHPRRGCRAGDVPDVSTSISRRSGWTRLWSRT